MLMLSRKTDQSITLRIPGHDDVVIKIVDLKNNQFGKLVARVGIDAPREIEIVRNEIIGTESDCPKSPDDRIDEYVKDRGLNTIDSIDMIPTDSFKTRNSF